MRVAILGSTGMLGSALTHVLGREFEKVIEFNRIGKSITGNRDVVQLDILKKYDLDGTFEGLGIDYIINAIGMIRQVIDDRNPVDVQNAQVINSEFAQRLNDFSLKTGTPIIQIGTDCVFSGSEGNYSEDAEFNPTDVYSKTKLSGEVASSESMIIRCSIIGKEQARSVSLLGWVLSQPKGSTINGYTNHLWNGLTTMHFAEVVSGIIESGNFQKGVVHLVPQDIVTKYELIKIIATEFGRTDLNLLEFSSENPVNRVLETKNPARNQLMWQQGGYDVIPTVQEMVSKYAKWSVDQ